MIRLAPELISRPDEVPIITPPARVAFKMCSILNFLFKTIVITKVDRLLAVRAKIVLVIIIVFYCAVTAKNPALKLGQNNHKKNVPINAKMLLIYVL